MFIFPQLHPSLLSAVMLVNLMVREEHIGVMAIAIPVALPYQISFRYADILP